MVQNTFNRETTGAEVVAACKDQVTGRTFLITGASDGSIGAEVALCLARAAPASIFLLARSAGKVDPVIKKIHAIDATVKVTFVPIQLDDFDTVRTAVKVVNDTTDRLDVIINCAGIMALPDFSTNKNGIESQFATNHLGHFLLTSLIFPKFLAAGKGSRIINVTSDGYMLGKCRFEDYNFKNGTEYHAWSGYGQSKTANILFTRQLATKLSERGITSFAPHPGVVLESGISRTSTKEMFDEVNEVGLRETGLPFKVGVPKPITQGTSTVLVAALDPQLQDQSGSYLEDCKVQSMRDYASSLENAQRLWTFSEELVGEKFDL